MQQLQSIQQHSKMPLDFLAAFSFNYNDQKIKAYIFAAGINGILFFPMHNDEILLDIPFDESVKNILNDGFMYLNKHKYTHSQIVYGIRERLKQIFKSNKQLKRSNHKIIPIDKIDMEHIIDIILDAVNKKRATLSVDEILQSRFNIYKKNLLIPFDELKEKISEEIINYCASISVYLFFQINNDVYGNKELLPEKIKELRKNIIRQEKKFIKENYYYNLAYTVKTIDKEQIYISQSFQTFNSLVTFWKKMYKLFDKYYLVLLNGNYHIEIERTAMNTFEKNNMPNYPMDWN